MLWHKVFFFKSIFPQKYWGKNEGWPFLLLTKQLMAQMFDQLLVGHMHTSFTRNNRFLCNKNCTVALKLVKKVSNFGLLGFCWKLLFNGGGKDKKMIEK